MEQLVIMKPIAKPRKVKEYRKPLWKNNIFHLIIGPVVIFGNIFGIMPVTGVLSVDVKKVKFKWISVQVWISILLIALGCSEIALTLIRVYARGVKFYSLGATTFYLVCETGLILFFRLARSWPEIARIWRKHDEIFLQNCYSLYIRTNLKFKIQFVASLMILFAIVEHGLYLYATFVNCEKQIVYCNFTFGVIENVFRRERAHIFDYVYFKIWMVPVLEWVNISMTLCWSFIDMFISLTSIGLTTRFNQISKRLLIAKTKIMPETFWVEMRHHYMAQIDLLYYLDHQLSGLILLSCANNLYQICVQLFNSFRPIPDLIDKIYFWYSLLFIIGRTLCMLFLAASVNDSSRKPLPILRSIPTDCWSLEVQRFANQVSYDQVAFSGKRFFFLTRKLIFAMIGTVATYEIVLLDRVDEYTDITNPCQIYGKI